MRRVAARLAALCLLLLLGFTAAPQVAYACSDDPANPFNPNTAAFIAEGWVERVTLRPDLADYANYTPVEVVMRVERTLKGSAPERVTFVDYGSAWQRPDGSVRWGAGGTCGILEADPAGKYALIVFGRWPDGRLLVNKIFGATFGSGPDDPQVERLRSASSCDHSRAQCRALAMAQLGCMHGTG